MSPFHKFILIGLLPLSGILCSKGKISKSGQVPADSTLMTINLSYEQKQGKILYKHYCVICHGESGAGDGFNSYNLNPRPRDLTDGKYMNVITDERLYEIVNQGGRGSNKSNLMPAWGGTLKSNEIKNIIAFIRALGDTSITKF